MPVDLLPALVRFPLLMPLLTAFIPAFVDNPLSKCQYVPGQVFIYGTRATGCLELVCTMLLAYMPWKDRG